MKRLLAILTAVATAIATGACTKPPKPPADAPGPASSIVPLSAEIRTAYLAYWAAWETANAESDLPDTGLAAHTGLPLLETLQANLVAARARHEVTRGAVTHRISGMVPAIAGGYTVVDCIDLDRWLLHDARTGAVLDQLVDKPSQLTLTTMRSDSGVWKATSLYPQGECP